MTLQTRVFWHSAFAAFLIVYAFLLANQLGHGLASLDAHAIVKVTRELADNHRFEVSRPPGHPTTETYLFPAIAWVLQHLFNREFDEQAYLICQGIGGIAALGAFYALLLRIGTQHWKAVVATICLGLSPQFFLNSVDGEEFVFAVLFLTGSLCLLLNRTDSAPSSTRLVGAICLFALATGCRPEVIFAGFLFPVYAMMNPKLGRRAAINLMMVEVVVIAAVWLPVVMVGMRLPYTSGMNVTESILGAAYRLVFQSFTVPVFALICWVLARSLSRWRHDIEQHFPNNFIFVAGCVTPIVFFGALLLHASKPSHILFALPFLLILAIRQSTGLLIVWMVATVAGFFITVAIFTERQLGRPHLTAGTYFAATREKPFYKLDYLQKVLQHCGPTPSAIIADVWRWDIEYNIRHGRLVAEEQQSHGDLPAFTVPQNHCLLFPRDVALHQDVIEDIAAHGYTIKMDATLYRTLFARYDVITPATNKARIGNTTVELFPITAPWR
jgi:hypothetical protein